MHAQHSQVDVVGLKAALSAASLVLGWLAGRAAAHWQPHFELKQQST